MVSAILFYVDITCMQDSLLAFSMDTSKICYGHSVSSLEVSTAFYPVAKILVSGKIFVLKGHISVAAISSEFPDNILDIKKDKSSIVSTNPYSKLFAIIQF